MNNSLLLDNVRESFGHIVYTHKTHEKMADRLEKKLKIYKWVELILITLTTGSIISVLFGTGKCCEVVSRNFIKFNSFNYHVLFQI